MTPDGMKIRRAQIKQSKKLGIYSAFPDQDPYTLDLIVTAIYFMLTIQADEDGDIAILFALVEDFLVQSGAITLPDPTDEEADREPFDPRSLN